MRSHMTRFHPEVEKHSAVPVVILLIYYKYAASSGTHFLLVLCNVNKIYCTL